jgi:hypothetical protein
MLGRKSLVGLTLAVAVAVGGGGALAATHDNASHPAKKRTPAFSVGSNVHYPCRKHGSPQALL